MDFSRTQRTTDLVIKSFIARYHGNMVLTVLLYMAV